jgi:hypothetical protein
VDGGGDPKSGLGIESAVVDVDSIGVGGACTASTALAGLSALVIQVNILIMNVNPIRWTMEAGKLTI